MTRGRAGRLVLPALCLGLALLFASLGVWQVERLRWKRDLIARVDARIARPPAPIPNRDNWATLDLKDLEYQPVRAAGTFLHASETLVDALTERGAGSWIVTPLRTDDGIVLVNRGFVPKVNAANVERPKGRVSVEGLARLSEPDGRFLRANIPSDDRWYSRDVEAMAKARGLGAVAPFFIDAAGSSDPNRLPIGGLTVVRFRNAHQIYAMTWFGLAVLCLIGFRLVMRSRREGDAVTKL